MPTTITDPLALDAVEAAAALAAGRISARELVAAALDAIAAAQPVLNAFLSVDAEGALAAAAAADRRLEALHAGACADLPPLLGVPLAHKDIFHRAGQPATAGSPLVTETQPRETATVLDRLDAAGAIALGTLNLSEFMLNPTGHNDHFGACRNPWDTTRIPGGSSSGTGAAVAARLCCAGLGSDTGGSVRLPAAMCGITAIKPTQGRVSRHGTVALSPSMDATGPMARSARDCARLLSLVAGPDPADAGAARRPPADYEADLERPLKGVRLGVATELHDKVAPTVARPLRESLAAFRDLGVELVEVRLPDLADTLALGSVVVRSEAAARHRRWLGTRPEAYMRLSRYRLGVGLALPATHYIEALGLRGAVTRRFLATAFAECDLLHAPIVPFAVPSLNAVRATPTNVTEVVTHIGDMTRPFNYLGLPAMAVPAGFCDDGLPVGLQLIGRPFAEARLLNAAHQFQRATDWHRRRPPALPGEGEAGTG